MTSLDAQLKSLFGFTHIPFKNDITPEDCFLYPDFEKGLQRLTYLAERRGIAVLVAPTGMGKSTLLRRFLAGLNLSLFFPAYVAETTCSNTGIHRLIAHALHVHPSFRKEEIFRQVKDRFSSLYSERGITPVLVVDEAHHLSISFFDELRLLSNFDVDSNDQFMLILSGQPQLLTSLSLSVNEAFNQRVVYRIQLSPFDLERTQEYVLHRLALAGRSAPLFANEAFHGLHQFSRGIPRLIDRLCEDALLLALELKRKQIDMETIHLAFEESQP